MTFTVEVGGVNYDKWEELTFSRAIKNNVGQFSLKISDTAQSIQINQLVKIYYDYQLCFTGWVNKLDLTGARSGGFITASGRCKCCDVIDSSVPDKAKQRHENLTLKSLIEQIIFALGGEISVVDITKDSVGSERVSVQKTADSGENVAAFFGKFATKLQAWLVSNEEGNITILRAGERKSNLPLLYLANGEQQNNILDAALTIDYDQLFSTIKCRGQSGIGYDVAAASALDFADMYGSAFDATVRKARYFEIKVSEVMTAKQLKLRALDELNYRKAQAFEYKVKTNFFTDKDNIIIKLGDLTKITDEIRDVRGEFVLASFDVSYSRQGTIVNRIYTPLEAYSIVEPSAREAKIKQSRHIAYEKDKKNA
jgi:prophage tail gpP-like protein